MEQENRYSSFDELGNDSFYEKGFKTGVLSLSIVGIVGILLYLVTQNF